MCLLCPHGLGELTYLKSNRGEERSYIRGGPTPEGF